MRRLMWVAVIPLLVACGGEGDTRAADETPTSSASATFTPPAHVESESCRNAAAAFLEIPDSLDISGPLDSTRFSGKVDQMTQQVDAAMATCSEDVENPIREGMYQWALAQAKWTTCQRGPCEGEIAKAITTGATKFDEAKRKLDARIG